MAKGLRIGELAKRTGLTARALRHYEQLGLLRSPLRSLAGQRVYDHDAVERLARVQALKSLGLPLAAIGQALARPDSSLAALLEQQLARADAELSRAASVRERLRQLAQLVRAQPSVSMDTLLNYIEATTMFEKYFTPEQLKTLENRKATLGAEQIESVQQEWPQLIAAMRKHLDAGDDPAGAEVQALAKRWRELVAQFTGGDAAIAQSTARMYRSEPQVGAGFGLDPALMDYVRKASACG